MADKTISHMQIYIFARCVIDTVFQLKKSFNSKPPADLGVSTMGTPNLTFPIVTFDLLEHSEIIHTFPIF